MFQTVERNMQQHGVPLELEKSSSREGKGVKQGWSYGLQLKAGTRGRRSGGVLKGGIGGRTGMFFLKSGQRHQLFFTERPQRSILLVQM